MRTIKRAFSALLTFVLVVGLLPAMSIEALAAETVEYNSKTMEGPATFIGCTIDTTTTINQLHAVMVDEILNQFTPTAAFDLPAREQTTTMLPVHEVVHGYFDGSKYWVEEPHCTCGSYDAKPVYGSLNAAMSINWNLALNYSGSAPPEGVVYASSTTHQYANIYSTEIGGTGETFKAMTSLPIKMGRSVKVLKYVPTEFTIDHYLTQDEYNASSRRGYSIPTEDFNRLNMKTWIGGIRRENCGTWNIICDGAPTFNIYTADQLRSGYRNGSATQHADNLVPEGTIPVVGAGIGPQYRWISLPEEIQELAGTKEINRYTNLEVISKSSGILAAVRWGRGSSPTSIRYGYYVNPDGTPEDGAIKIKPYSVDSTFTSYFTLQPGFGARVDHFNGYSCASCGAGLSEVYAVDMIDNELSYADPAFLAALARNGLGYNGLNGYYYSTTISGGKSQRAKVTGITFRDCVIKAMPDLFSGNTLAKIAQPATNRNHETEAQNVASY